MLENCPRVIDLKIEELDFGDDPSEITNGIIQGFANLHSLDLALIQGDIRMLVSICPMPNLNEFSPYGYAILLSHLTVYPMTS
jgi:hypothetical protein